MYRFAWIVWALVSVIAYSNVASAVERTKVGSIVLTISTDGSTYGGCMLKMDVPMGSGCGSNFVSLDCSGDFHPKDMAYRMWDSALMAYALGRVIVVRADDAMKHNGHCVATRLDVRPAAP